MSIITVSVLVTGSNGFHLPLYSYPHPGVDAAAEVAVLNAGTPSVVTVTGTLSNGILSVAVTNFADSNNPRLIALAANQVYQEAVGVVMTSIWLQLNPSGTATNTGTLVASAA